MELQHVRNLLRIVKTRIDDELELQAQMAETISSHVATMNSRQLEAKAELERVEARLCLQFRNSDSKMPANEIDARTKLDTSRIHAFGAFQKARHEYEEWLGAQDAWRQRGFALSKLGDIYVAGYFDAQQTSAGNTHVVPPEMTRATRVDRSETVERAVQARREERAARFNSPDPAPSRVQVRARG